jgi:hypothetical protein
MDEGAGSETPWLGQLEERVATAVTEIGRLRQENRRLERELARLRKGAGAGGEGPAAWEREKVEVKGRVERLVHRLEELLGAGAVAAMETPAAAAAPAATRPAADEPPSRQPVQRTLEPVEE